MNKYNQEGAIVMILSRADTITNPTKLFLRIDGQGDVLLGNVNPNLLLNSKLVFCKSDKKTQKRAKSPSSPKK